MRLMNKLAGLPGVVLAGLAADWMLSGAAFAQALETIGEPIPGGTGFQPAATELAREMQWLDHMILIIITAITAFVVLLLALVAVRFRAGRNPKPATFTHNTPIEIAWTLIPILVLVFIGSFSLPALFKSQEIPVADITIKATGNQWYWSYDYVDDGVTFDSYMIGSPATGGANMLTPEVEKQLTDAGYKKEDFLLATDTAMVIPVGKTIVLQVTASDVIHSWKIPAFGVMQDGVPGRLAHLWFKAEKEGVYFGQCSELCGLMHTYMPITVKVVSQEAYDKWLAGAKEGNLTLASN
jgi:cytochrome c oxidase subunit 2